MYLHLGQDTLVNTSGLLGMFDLDSTTLSSKSREYLALAEKEKRVVNVSTELPKSFVVVTGENSGDKNHAEQRRKATVYISQLTTATLKKRMYQRLK